MQKKLFQTLLIAAAIISLNFSVGVQAKTCAGDMLSSCDAFCNNINAGKNIFCNDETVHHDEYGQKFVTHDITCKCSIKQQ